MGIKFYIFALVALGLSSRARATEAPVCACVDDDVDGCGGVDDACGCEGTKKCTITVLPVDGADPALECDGASCVCEISEPTAPSCSGGPKLATGASLASVDYTVVTDGTASCQFTLSGTDASDFQCTTLTITDVVQMGTLFSCSGVAISTADDEGCVFVKGVSVKCEDTKECTVASIDNEAFKCEGLQCFIQKDGLETTVSSEGGEAVVSVSDTVGCTNPASSGDCECDLTAASCTSSVDGAVVKGGGDTCTVDGSTCTCDATGCGGGGGDDVAKCTCEPLTGDLDAACDGDDTACACKVDGECKVSVSQGDNATGLTCSGKTCSCSLPSGPDGGAASCSVEVSGGSITSGLTDAELTVVATADSITAICQLTISSSEVSSPVCLGGDTETISNKHFTCSGVAFDTAAPTGCNMTDADRASCVGDDSCKIESIDVDEAECNGVKCEAHFATLVTMSSTGGEALVSASSIVHCTNPTDEGTCRCTADADLGVYICSSESDDGSVSGGSTGTETCENSSCMGCPGATFCKCTAETCDLCSCNAQPTDGPTGQPSDGPTGQPSDGPTDMGSTDDTETTTRGLPSSATQSALNVGLMAVVAVGGIALR